MAESRSLDSAPLAAGSSAPAESQSSFFARHPTLGSWLLVLPGTLWMVTFVGVPLASIILFSFWKSGFAGLRPDYNLRNYSKILTSDTFWSITLWTYEVILMALAGVIMLAYPAAYFIWRVIKDERWKTGIILLCIVPFWTSYLTRTRCSSTPPYSPGRNIGSR